MPSGAADIRPGGGRRLSRAAREEAGAWYPRWFWPSFSIPATLWLLLLFVLPFYTIVSVAFGKLDPIFQSPVPVWNPLKWDFTSFRYVLNQTLGRGGIFQPAFIRTFVYVGIAVAICLLIGYPVAYFIARYGGRYKGWLLVGLIAPFWISYLMRMLAWVNLLQDDGLVNKALMGVGLISAPVNWLDGKAFTVVLGLAYGYIPFMILPLYGALDRIDRSVLEAARDLGANRVRTFRRVTLPLSRQAILAGVIIVTLPMMGDYYTNNLLSGSPRTNMVGNLIDNTVQSPLVTQAASMVIILTLLLIVPMLYYLWSTNRATRERVV